MKPTEFERTPEGFERLTDDYLTYMAEEAPHITYYGALQVIGLVSAFQCYKPFQRYAMGNTTCN